MSHSKGTSMSNDSDLDELTILLEHWSVCVVAFLISDSLLLILKGHTFFTARKAASSMANIPEVGIRPISSTSSSPILRTTSPGITRVKAKSESPKPSVVS